MVGLKIVIPDGSLETVCDELFHLADLPLHPVQHPRTKLYTVDDPRIDCVKKRRPNEIPKHIAYHWADVAIASQDWLKERQMAAKFEFDPRGLTAPFIAQMTPSGLWFPRVRLDTAYRRPALLIIPFSRTGQKPVRIIVAVKNESPYRSIKDLPEGFTVATEYPWITEAYLYRKFHLRSTDTESDTRRRFSVLKSSGNTEQKILDGLAEAIVEITEEGTSLKVNGLRIIDEIMQSYPVIIASSYSMSHPRRRSLVRWFVEQMRQGVMKLQEKREKK